MGQHHKLLAPSKLHRAISCAASAVAESSQEDTTNEFAELGTVLHDISHRVMVDEEPLQTFLGVTLTSEAGYDFTIDRDHIDIVQTYLDHCRDLMMGSDHWDSEVQVDLSDWVQPDDEGTPAGGTADFLAIKDRVLYVRDLKTGRGTQVDAIVDGEFNPQLMAYATGAYDALAMFYDIDRVNIGIVQPPLDHIVEADVLLAEIEDFKLLLLDLDTKVRQPDPPYGPSVSACKYCLVRHECRARAQWALDTAGLSLEHTASELTDLETLTNKDRGRLLHRMKGLRDWMDDLHADSLTRALRGEDIPGWKPIAGNNQRAWADEEVARKYISGVKRPVVEEGQSQRFTIDEYAPRKVLSPAQAEKLLGKELAPRLERFIEVTPGSPRLVVSTHKAPSVARAFGKTRPKTERPDEHNH